MLQWKQRNKEMLNRSRFLRRNPTPSERKLWSVLWDLQQESRQRGFKRTMFRRQIPITRYILDFYFHRYRFAIEVDGLYHDPVKDQERDEFLFSRFGITTVRFTNSEIENEMDRVKEEIQDAVSVLTGMDPYWQKSKRQIKREQLRSMIQEYDDEGPLDSWARELAGE